MSIEQRVTFGDCLKYALQTEFFSEWTRLREHKRPTSPLDAMIDEATGMNDHISRQFILDVYELIWLRLPIGVRENQHDLPSFIEHVRAAKRQGVGA